jgi:hypothetical protein
MNKLLQKQGKLILFKFVRYDFNILTVAIL